MHTLVWIYLSVRRPLVLSLDLIFFHPIQGRYSDAQVFSVAAPATSWCTQLFYFYTGNQSVTCSTCISLNIQLLDMLHQPNTMQPTEIQFAAENGAPPPIPPQGYSEVAANRSSGDISKKKKNLAPIKAKWIKAI